MVFGYARPYGKSRTQHHEYVDNLFISIQTPEGAPLAAALAVLAEGRTAGLAVVAGGRGNYAAMFAPHYRRFALWRLAAWGERPLAELLRESVRYSVARKIQNQAVAAIRFSDAGPRPTICKYSARLWVGLAITTHEASGRSNPSVATATFHEYPEFHHHRIGLSWRRAFVEGYHRA